MSINPGSGLGLVHAGMAGILLDAFNGLHVKVEHTLLCVP